MGGGANQGTNVGTNICRTLYQEESSTNVSTLLERHWYSGRLRNLTQSPFVLPECTRYTSLCFVISNVLTHDLCSCRLDAKGQCLYRHLVHVVRHPLKFLSSNFAFGQCVECWALVETGTKPPIFELTGEVRAAIKANRAALYQQTGGRTWSPEVRLGMQLFPILLSTCITT